MQLNPLSTILAATDDEGLPKILFGAIFVIFWLISAIMSSAAKKREEQRRKQIQLDIPPAPPLPPLRSVPIPPPMPQPANRPPQRIKQQSTRIVKQLKKAIRGKSQPPRIAAATAQASAPPFSVAPPMVARAAVPTPAVPVSATAATLRAWMQPATLRQQFIVTEIFQPPLGMRE